MSITLECHLIQRSLGALPEVYLAKAQGHSKAQTLLHKLFGSPGAWSAACPGESASGATKGTGAGSHCGGSGSK